MVINDMYVAANESSTSSCGCKKELAEANAPVELTKLQFSVLAPKSEHIALLTKISEFLTTLGFPISNFESYRY